MSWDQLAAITQEAKQMLAEDRAAPVVACPACGEPLKGNAAGIMRCPEGHYETRRGAPTQV